MSNKKVLKYLKQDKWYHGTSLAGWKEICDKSVLVEHNRGTELDFGYGFYLTPKQEQAEKFITNIIKYRTQDEMKNIPFIDSSKDATDDEIAVVIEFIFEPIIYFEDQSYNFGVYNAYNDEFAEFVFKNSLEPLSEDHQNYDMIFGVMSDSNPIVAINRYKNKGIGKNEVLEEFKKSTSFKQLSIHNQKICDILVVNKAYIIENGEELKIDDYNKRHGFKLTK